MFLILSQFAKIFKSKTILQFKKYEGYSIQWSNEFARL